MTARRIRNAADDLGAEHWHKPWSGGNGGQCVEAKKVDGGVAVRHSTDPDGPALVFTRDEWAAFTEGVQTGKADFLLS